MLSPHGTADSEILERKTYAKVTWRLIPFLFLCYILAFLDRVNVSFAKLQMLQEPWFSDAIFACGAGVFFIGYFLFEVPSNIILRKIGARTWIARIMITWGVISAAMMFARSATVFYLLRFLLGIAEAGFFPGIIFYLTCWYPARHRARMIAWFMTAIAVAGVIGNPLSGWIIDSFDGTMGLAGWRLLFLLEGLPSIGVGVWVIFRLDSRIERAKWLTDEEKALLQRNLELDNQGKRHARLRDAFASGRVWLLCLVYFCMAVGIYGVGFWLPTTVKALGVNGYLNIGLLSAIPYGVAMVGMVLLGRSSDATGERRWHTALASFAGGLGLILCGIFGQSAVLSIVFLSLATLGILAAPPLFWTLPTAFLTGAASAAGIGIINSFGNLGGYVGPNIPVWVKPLSARAAFPLYVIAAGLFLAGILVICFVRDERIGKKESWGETS